MTLLQRAKTVFRLAGRGVGFVMIGVREITTQRPLLAGLLLLALGLAVLFVLWLLVYIV